MGNYQFSGFQTATPAFSRDATTGVVTYEGDLGQRLLQVDTARQMAVNSPGQTVFQGGGQDVFETLNDLITLLKTPAVDQVIPDPVNSPDSQLTIGLAAANGKLDLALDNVLTVRASIGSRLQELDALDSAGEDRHIQYSQILSDLQDLDYTKALTQLSQQQITLEAAQRSFVTISGLSLFNFL
jgi:flagellar hook-associated protein 3 FlgL